MRQIQLEVYRKVQVLQGKADAEATAIYAAAYNQSPEAREFYGFTRALETYRKSFRKDTTVILFPRSRKMDYKRVRSPCGSCPSDFSNKAPKRPRNRKVVEKS